MLIHMQVGTPMFVTWWHNGDLPRMAPNDWINFTFGFITVFLSVILTTVSLCAINAAIGIRSLSFSTESAWKFAVAHGILMIWVTGMWMVVACVGVPPLGKAKALKPEIKPPLAANPKDCIGAHRFDILVGCVLLFLGNFFLNDESIIALPLKACVALAWIIGIMNKIEVHKKSWGYKPPVEEIIDNGPAEKSHLLTSH